MLFNDIGYCKVLLCINMTPLSIEHKDFIELKHYLSAMVTMMLPA